jgi:hypothetical protein
MLMFGKQYDSSLANLPEVENTGVRFPKTAI